MAAAAVLLSAAGAEAAFRWEGAAPVVEPGPAEPEPPPLMIPSSSSGRAIVPQPLPPAAQAPVSPPVSTAPAGSYTVVRGFGKGMDLATAVSIVVPPSFAVSWPAGAPRDAKVSWSGDRPWPDVLRDMLAPLGLKADVGLATVDIARSEPAVAAPAPAPAPVLAPVTEVAAAAPAPLVRPAGSDVSPTAAPAAPMIDTVAGNLPSRTWHVSAGDMLWQTLERWAADAGWTVQWDNPERDYPLRADATFEGPFITQTYDGAISGAAPELLRLFANAKPPVRAKFYFGNRVLRVWVTEGNT